MLLQMASCHPKRSSSDSRRFNDSGKKVRQRSEQTGEQLELGAELLESAVLLCEHPRELYEQMGPDQRRLLNQAIFERLYVSDENDLKVAALFNLPFGELLEAREEIGRLRRDKAGLPIASAGNPDLTWQMFFMVVFLKVGLWWS